MTESLSAGAGAGSGAAPERSRVVDLVRARGAAAQLAVLRDGVPVVDVRVGCAPDDLFWTFSASKPIVTVALLRFVERRLVDPDAPVADTWPEFGANGKGGITLRHVLQHRAGFATAGGMLGDALAMADWERSIRRIESIRPRHAPGGDPAYLWLAYGFILGEVLRRVAGRPVRDVLVDEVLSPAGMRRSRFGLDGAEAARAVPVTGAGPAGRFAAALVNRPSTRAAVIPSAGLSTTAGDLAAFYANLIGDGPEPPLLRPETLADATRPTSDGVFDRFARSPIRWSNGFQLGGDRGVPGAVSPMGRSSGRATFGHNGSNCCLGWADPDRRIAFAYLTNRLPPVREGFGHLVEVADAVLEACG